MSQLYPLQRLAGLGLSFVRSVGGFGFVFEAGRIMDSLLIFFVVVGIFTIVKHLPYVFVLRGALRFYDRLFLSSDARVRVWGVVNFVFAMALLLLPFSGETLAGLLRAVG